MAHATMPREALVQKLSAVFRTHGYEGASLARLSAATGLVKASLYYQFPRAERRVFVKQRYGRTKCERSFRVRRMLEP